jgi:hypothetical protein
MKWGIVWQGALTGMENRNGKQEWKTGMEIRIDNQGGRSR